MFSTGPGDSSPDQSTDRSTDPWAVRVVEVHEAWLRALGARLRGADREGPLTPARVQQLWHEVARLHPVLRASLDAHETHPALAPRLAEEHAMLARAAGLADADTGRALVRARVPQQRVG